MQQELQLKRFLDSKLRSALFEAFSLDFLLDPVQLLSPVDELLRLRF